MRFGRGAKGVLWFVRLCVLVSLAGCAVEEKTLSVRVQAERFQRTESLLSEAVLLMRSGELSESRACLEMAFELSPRNARVYDGLGALAWRERDYESAERWFKQAVELDPEYSRPYAHLALIAGIRGDEQAAQTLFEMAIERDPLEHRARNNYAAFLLFKHGRDAQARARAQAELLKSLQLTPDKRDPIIEQNLRLVAESVRQ